MELAATAKMDRNACLESPSKLAKLSLLKCGLKLLELLRQEQLGCCVWGVISISLHTETGNKRRVFLNKNVRDFIFY